MFSDFSQMGANQIVSKVFFAPSLQKSDGSGSEPLAKDLNFTYTYVLFFLNIIFLICFNKIRIIVLTGLTWLISFILTSFRLKNTDLFLEILCKPVLFIQQNS